MTLTHKSDFILSIDVFWQQFMRVMNQTAMNNNNDTSNASTVACQEHLHVLVSGTSNRKSPAQLAVTANCHYVTDTTEPRYKSSALLPRDAL